MLGLLGCAHRPKVTRYILDSWTVGFVKVVYDHEGAPPLPVQNGFAVVQIPASRIVFTSNRMNPAWEGSEFYYRGLDGKLERLTLSDNDQRKLWGLEKISDRDGHREEFFVGTQRQFSRGVGGGKELLSEEPEIQSSEDIDRTEMKNLLKVDNDFHK